MTPKVFVSYSWSSASHQELVRSWADRLLAEGVEVILDVYDLKDGHDKFHFMEKMVTDPTVTHVLVCSDRVYAEKADARKAGVGTETQIISQEIYGRVEQSKFIPIACEFDEHGAPFLPVFLKSRIYIDFSGPESVNQNWERLVRTIYGKPLLEKPKLGSPPAYLQSSGSSSGAPAAAKLSTLRNALLSARPGIALYRRDFLDSCLALADELRVRERPEVEISGERVLEDCGKLKIVRNLLVDWIVTESSVSTQADLADTIIDVLERLRAMKGRPAELNQWSDSWFEAHGLFVYETFVYLVAALVKNRSYALLHTVLSARYMLPQSERYGSSSFATYKTFFASSSLLQSVLAPAGRRLHSPAAALVRQQADRPDLPFDLLMEADALLLFFAVVNADAEWFPQLLYYLPYSTVPMLFARAESKRHFAALSAVSGVSTGDAVRAAWAEGTERLHVGRWSNFDGNFYESLNIARLDTIP